MELAQSVGLLAHDAKRHATTIAGVVARLEVGQRRGDQRGGGAFGYTVPRERTGDASRPGGKKNAPVAMLIQRKFLEHAALQCGICTPGVLIAARSLLERNPDPSEEEVRYWLAGNLCRCTGYNKIVEAVLDAAGEMRGG